MPETIFFSWQLDTDPDTGKYFLLKVFKDACKQLSEEPEFVEAERDFEADSDTQNVPGQPHVAETILKKIGEASIFAADLTYIGASDNGKKRLPNPNVLLEYGWALRALGANRIISVMNIANGDPADYALPFDLNHFRWPIRFNLPADADKPTIKKVQAELTGTVKRALQAQLKHREDTLAEPAPLHIARESREGRSRFRRQDEMVGMTWDPYMPFPVVPDRKVLLATGPTMYLRLIPEHPIEKHFGDRQLAEAALQTGALRLRPFTSVGDIYRLRAEDGVGVCWSINGDNATESVVFAFEDGEVWSVDAALLRVSQPNMLPVFEIEQAFTEGMSNYLAFLRYLGLQGRYRWIAGLEGVSGRKFWYSASATQPHPFYGQQMLTDSIEVNDTLDIETPDPRHALAPFFSRIYQKCGLEYRAPQQR